MIALNQATFCRLVQLHLLVFALEIVLVIVEMSLPGWQAFDQAFQALLSAHFTSVDEYSDAFNSGVVIVTAALIAANVTSEIGLLWFKAWARPAFALSTLAIFVIPLPFPGVATNFTTPWTELVMFSDYALTGMILLMAYARDQGAHWFASTSVKTES